MLRIAQDAVVRIGVGQGAVMDWARMVAIAGITVHPNEMWMKQMTRNATLDEYGALLGCRYLLHDHDTKFTRSLRAIVASGKVDRWCCLRRAQT
jgi:hypothetical protein